MIVHSLVSRGTMTHNGTASLLALLCLGAVVACAKHDVTFRPGSGHATVQEYVDGKVPVPTTPLAGVGDRAVWQASLNEVVAEKDNKLCDISVQGSGMGLKDRSPAAMQKKIGALCNKIFAAQ